MYELEKSKSGSSIILVDCANDGVNLCVETSVAKPKEKTGEDGQICIGGDVCRLLNACWVKKWRRKGNVDESQCITNDGAYEAQNNHRVSASLDHDMSKDSKP